MHAFKRTIKLNDSYTKSYVATAAIIYTKPENVAIIATGGRPTPRQSFSASITTPLPSLKPLNLSAAVYSVFIVDSLHYTVT